ncbi:transposase [uncultured Tateyamaria sp.]|uniref:REP-associated tyrosine transposase n=1 Tax=uncultured Tateyamaria sp. TaxID=455651 RepID=UPI0026233433|nr:transposase [uncultured Tateyamaria sp.]
MDDPTMSSYRRFRVDGATYFFTVNLADRSSDMLVDHIDHFRIAYARTWEEHPFRCDAMVVLPDHVHAVWTLPRGDTGYSERWRKIKARFSHALGGVYARSQSKEIKREVGVWQRRFWEHCIRDEADYRAHVAYCWSNPVKHGYVERAVEWPYSSIHRDVRMGQVEPEWCGAVLEGAFGE